MSELYVCKQYNAPYERVCKITTTLAKHDSELLDKFVARLKDYFVIPHDVSVIEQMAEELKAEVSK